MAALTTVRERARWRFRQPAWLRAVGIGNLLATAFLLGAAVWLVDEQPHGGGPWAFVVVWLAILPLLVARRHPAAAALAVAVGVLVSQLLIGPLVTCGVVLPTVFAMTFQLGSRLVTSTQLAVGGAGLVGACLVELLLDPVLGVEAAVFVGSLLTTFFLGGLMVRSRVRMAYELRRRTDELAEQRERTATLAVQADRERISSDLERGIRARVATLAEAAAYAQAHADDPVRVAAAYGEMEREGRETLTLMRTVVGDLRDAPTLPPPGIDDLATLVRGAAASGARIRLTGDVRALAPNLELTVYRIVEQLLTTLADDAVRSVEVTVAFRQDTIEIRIAGPARTGSDAAESSHLTAALTAARTRAEVAGGSLTTFIGTGRQRVLVQLPTPDTGRWVA